ncbi:MAG: PhzF family phenazine biosynthesis protein [Colwellia sp.]|nr:PhzF family phenazine biosynthesis protein [Colwellia sp.]
MPLPVFTDATGLTDKKMLQIAGELNASNTIFLIFCEQKSTYSIKAFSKFEEVSIGSHSILAASYVLAKIGVVTLTAKHTLITFESNWTEKKETINTYVSKDEQGAPSLVQQTYQTSPAIAHHEDPPIGSAIPAFASHICAHPHIQTGTHVFGI